MTNITLIKVLKWISIGFVHVSLFALNTFLWFKSKSPDIPTDFGLVKNLDVTKFQEQFITVITDEARMDDPRILEEARSFYKLCSNQTLIEEDGYDLLQEVIVDLNKNLIQSETHWISVFPKFKRIGYNQHEIIAVEILPHPDAIFSTHKKKYQIHVRLAVLENRTHKCDEEIEEYSDSIIENMLKIGLIEDSVIRQMSFFLLELFKKTCQVKPTSAEIMTIRELNSKIPNVPWTDFINQMIPYDKYHVTEDDELHVDDPAILANLVGNIKQNQGRVFKSWMMWNLILSLRYFLPMTIRNEMSTLIEDDFDQSRDKWCMDQVLNALPLTFLKAYDEKYDSSRTVDKLRKIFNDVRNQQLAMLDELNWEKKRYIHYARYRLEQIELYSLGSTTLEYINHTVIDETIPEIDNISKNPKLLSILKINGLNVRRERILRARNSTEEESWLQSVQKDWLNIQYYAEKHILYIPPAFDVDELLSQDSNTDYAVYSVFGTMMSRIMTPPPAKNETFNERGTLNWFYEAFINESPVIFDKLIEYMTKCAPYLAFTKTWKMEQSLVEELALCSSIPPQSKDLSRLMEIPQFVANSGRFEDSKTGLTYLEELSLFVEEIKNSTATVWLLSVIKEMKNSKIAIWFEENAFEYGMKTLIGVIAICSPYFAWTFARPCMRIFMRMDL